MILGATSFVYLTYKAITIYYSYKKPKIIIETNNNNATYFDWAEPFSLSKEQLKKIIQNFQNEMNKGLLELSNENNKSTLKMLPSFVSKPTGQEKGTFYALDLGGTNFRVIRLELEGNGKIGKLVKEQFTISQEAMTGTSENLFDFIADCVHSFIQKYPTEHMKNNKIILGFTFSFPVNQTKLASGTLINWTKGFSTKGVVGQDVVKLLNETFQRKHIEVETVALVNDTVGTMVACSYSNSTCEMGIIMGTGTNACYIEKIQNIKKLKEEYKKDNMIINIEWGGFGDYTDFLPLSKADKQLDENSINKGSQIFEKMISGMYLGEIVRYILIDLMENKRIFNERHNNNEIPTKLKQNYSFATTYMTEILNDTTPELLKTRALIEENLQIKGVIPYAERVLLRDICRFVSIRASRLCAAAIIAVLEKINRLQNTVVAIDGGVFEHLPGVKEEIIRTIKELQPESNIELVLSKDGSGIGAAIIAAIATSN
jgi:hexokinase